MDEILKRHCLKAGITLKQIQGGGQAKLISHARSEIAHALVKELRLSYTEIARQLGVLHAAVSKMMKRQMSDE